MLSVRRLVLVRHGETDGQSSVRYLGRTDVELSSHGREQMQALVPAVREDGLDLVFSSPLKRAWQSAWIVAAGRPVQLVDELREIDFGRWEGLTREEIEGSDPILAKDWQAGAEGFEYPGGEPRAHFDERVKCGLAHILSQPARGALVVAHKGVIRTIVKELTGTTPERETPALGSRLVVTWQPGGVWIVGTRSSNPPGLPVPGDLVV